MQSNQLTARIAGVLYLVVVLAGIFSLGYVPGQLHVAGDAAATVANITAQESLFRLGIAAGMVCYVAFLLLPLVLYRLLSPYGKVPGVLMVVFAVASVPMSLLALGHKLTVLSLLGDAEYLQLFSEAQRQAQVMLSLQAYRSALSVAEIFWGLWLLPFGYLVYTSRILPRVLGILLMLGSVGYLVEIFGDLLWTGYADSALARIAGIPASVGEIGICLWLLVMGARARRRLD